MGFIAYWKMKELNVWDKVMLTVLEPLGFAAKKFQLFLWCRDVIKPLKGRCKAAYWGSAPSTLTGLNYWRAVYSLYQAVYFMDESRSFRRTDVVRILNWSKKYKEQTRVDSLREAFQSVLQKWRLHEFGGTYPVSARYDLSDDGKANPVSPPETSIAMTEPLVVTELPPTQHVD